MRIGPKNLSALVANAETRIDAHAVKLLRSLAPEGLQVLYFEKARQAREALAGGSVGGLLAASAQVDGTDAATSAQAILAEVAQYQTASEQIDYQRRTAKAAVRAASDAAAIEAAVSTFLAFS